jgi:hypothetical protein
MMKHLVRLALAGSLVALASASTVNAQTALNNKTVLTFTQPVEVPGKILPAGTYTFELHDSGMNRHVVEIFEGTSTKLVALVLAIPDYRLKATEETVLRFNEGAPGVPQAIRAWFYPGQTVGQELVYSRTRALELAAASNVAVPAVDDAMYVEPKAETMTAAPLVAITPERKEAPMTMFEMTPARPVMLQNETPQAAPREALPHTASSLPLVALFGAGLLALGLGLRRRNAASVTR